MIWKIYYADGSIYSDEDGSWDSAPADGVVCICVADETFGKVILNQKDFYYRGKDGDKNDLYLTNDLGPQLRLQCPWLKFGVALPKAEFSSIVEKAIHDTDFPPSQKPQRRGDDWTGVVDGA